MAVVDNSNQRLIFGTGSGVTLRSDAEREYREELLKAAILLPQPKTLPALFETMRLEDGEIFLEADHLARLMASLRHYGLPDRQADVERALLDG